MWSTIFGAKFGVISKRKQNSRGIRHARARTTIFSFIFILFLVLFRRKTECACPSSSFHSSEPLCSRANSIHPYLVSSVQQQLVVLEVNSVPPGRGNTDSRVDGIDSHPPGRWIGLGVSAVYIVHAGEVRVVNGVSRSVTACLAGMQGDVGRATSQYILWYRKTQHGSTPAYFPATNVREGLSLLEAALPDVCRPRPTAPP